MEITLDEDKFANGKLNNENSRGVDELVSGIYKNCVDMVSPSLLNLFNVIFESGIYPTIWSTGIIVPIPKKGDLNNVDNYRGINIMSTV